MGHREGVLWRSNRGRRTGWRRKAFGGDISFPFSHSTPGRGYAYTQCHSVGAQNDQHRHRPAWRDWGWRGEGLKGSVEDCPKPQRKSVNDATSTLPPSD
jgi:hypothetical protein